MHRDVVKTGGIPTQLFQRHAADFDSILRYQDEYQVQVIYNQLDRGAKNRPHFKDNYYQVDRHRYFYPASTVKMPAAFLALEKLNKLSVNGLDKYTPMYIDSTCAAKGAVCEDTTASDAPFSLAQYIKKMFIVSDNDAFNHVYEFLGQQYLNNQLHRKGYRDAEIIHRLDVMLTEEQNRYTNPVTFRVGNQVLYHQQAQFNATPFPHREEKLGRAYLSKGQLVLQPMDFPSKNRIALEDLHHLLRTVMFPESVPAWRRFRLKAADYSFLYRCMSQLPTETIHPAFDSTMMHDAYCKFFLYGAEKQATIPSHLRIFNKVGWAYGFLLDIAYVVDFDKRVEFMLSAVINVNKDGILGDDQYEYETTGLPFLNNLGKMIYEYELQRPRKYLPDLSRFKVTYERPHSL